MATRKELEKQYLYLKELEKRKSKEDYYFYWKATNPELVMGKHIRFIIEQVKLLLSGELGKDILILSIPPQHGKSETITKTLPSFIASQGQRVLITAYNEELAKEFNAANRDKIKNFNIFDVTVQKDTAETVSLTNKGRIFARGISSGITGNPADLIIIDDPIKGYADAYSESHRNSVWREFQMSIRSRLSASGKIILIQTRWHEDDLAGRIQNVPEMNSVTINIPCIAEENDILGRAVGEGLFPEIGKDTEWAQKFRRTYMSDAEGGSSSWNALYQGRPSSEGGNILKRDSWQYYDYRPEFLKTLPTMILSVDAAFKGTAKNDKVSIQVWGKKGAYIYGIDNVTDNMTFTETLRAIRNMLAKYPMIGTKFVEDKANGSAIIEVMNKEVGGFVPVSADTSTGGKVARVMAIEPYVTSGNIFLPKETAWVNDFVEECSSFPNGKYKDQVDAMSQALNRLIHYYSGIDRHKATIDEQFFGVERKKQANNLLDDSFLTYGT